MTLTDVLRAMTADPKNWRIPFMEFVDDFRRERKSVDISNHPEDPTNRDGALIASTVEYLCREAGCDRPPWTSSIPACESPWFVAAVENLKAIALVETPLEFRRRKIFVLANFLSRA